jgi:WD40 repeat protein
LGGITSLAVNPASTIAVVGGANGGVRVVSLSKGEVISALGGHTDENSVEAIVFVNIVGAVDGSSAPVGSAGAGTVVTGATDGKVCIWDLSTNRLRTTLEHKVGCVVAFLILHSVVTLIHRMPSRACWCTQQSRTLLFRPLQTIPSEHGMREPAHSCGSTRVTKTSSTVPRWGVMEKL